MKLKKLKFDSVSIELSSALKTDKIDLKVTEQLQDVQFNVTHIGKSDSKFTNLYNPILGGFENDYSSDTISPIWKHISSQGQIPWPIFQTGSNNFIIDDPTNRNPQYVDQNGMVPKELNFMEVQVEPVYVQFTSTQSDGEESIFQQSQKLLTGYVAKFVDTVNHQIHTVFIDATVASDMPSAIQQARQKIENVNTWDKPHNAQTFGIYAEQNHLAFEKLGDNTELAQQDILDFKDDIETKNEKIEIEFDGNGNFLRVIGLASGDLTHIESQEVQVTNTNKEIIINVQQNPQLSFHSGGKDLSVSASWNNVADPNLDSIRQKIVTAGFDLNALYGLEIIKDIIDSGVTLRESEQAPSYVPLTTTTTQSRASTLTNNQVISPTPAPGVTTQAIFEPIIKGPNGLEIKLTPAEANAYLKMLLISIHQAKQGTPLYDFISQLYWTFDSTTGDIQYRDSSNGKYGYKIDDAQSRFHFTGNHGGFEISIAEVNKIIPSTLFGDAYKSTI